MCPRSLCSPAAIETDSRLLAVRRPRRHRRHHRRRRRQQRHRGALQRAFFSLLLHEKPDKLTGLFLVPLAAMEGLQVVRLPLASFRRHRQLVAHLARLDVRSWPPPLLSFSLPLSHGRLAFLSFSLFAAHRPLHLSLLIFRHSFESSLPRALFLSWTLVFSPVCRPGVACAPREQRVSVAQVKKQGSRHLSVRPSHPAITTARRALRRSCVDQAPQDTRLHCRTTRASTEGTTTEAEATSARVKLAHLPALLARRRLLRTRLALPVLWRLAIPLRARRDDLDLVVRVILREVDGLELWTLLTRR